MLGLRPVKFTVASEPSLHRAEKPPIWFGNSVESDAFAGRKGVIAPVLVKANDALPLRWFTTALFQARPIEVFFEGILYR